MLYFTGEGGTSEGDFHEALNLASVWQLPVLFCIENNGYGLSTPTSEQYRVKHLAERGAAYAMESHRIEGNNIVKVYQKITTLTASMRKQPRPVLVEFDTFRMRGHEEASGTAYVPKKLMATWAKKDPVEQFEQFLVKEKLLSTKERDVVKAAFNETIQTAWEKSKSPSHGDI